MRIVIGARSFYFRSMRKVTIPRAFTQKVWELSFLQGFSLPMYESCQWCKGFYSQSKRVATAVQKYSCHSKVHTHTHTINTESPFVTWLLIPGFQTEHVLKRYGSCHFCKGFHSQCMKAVNGVRAFTPKVRELPLLCRSIVVIPKYTHTHTINTESPFVTWLLIPGFQTEHVQLAAWQLYKCLQQNLQAKSTCCM